MRVKYLIWGSEQRPGRCWLRISLLASSEQVLAEALRTAQAIKNSYYRAQALAGLAPHIVELGEASGGAAHRPRHRGQLHSRSGLGRAGSHLTELGQWRRRCASAQGIEDSSAHAWALAGLTPRRAELRQQAEAPRTAHGIEDSSTPARSLAELAPHLDGTGTAGGGAAHRPRHREQLCPRWPWPSWRRTFLLCNCQRHCALPKASRTATTALMPWQDWLRSMVEQGQVAEALRTAQGIESSSTRCSVLGRAGAAPDGTGTAGGGAAHRPRHRGQLLPRSGLGRAGFAHGGTRTTGGGAAHRPRHRGQLHLRSGLGRGSSASLW